MIRLVIGRVLPGKHVGAKCLGSVRDEFRSISISADKFGRRSKCQVQEVVVHQDLSITIRPSANANCGGCYFCGDHGCDFAGNTFEVNARDTRAIECDSVAHQLLDGCQTLALNFVSAHHVY